MLNNAKDAQILIKPIYFGHFLPYFWVKIRSKMGKMHRLYGSVAKNPKIEAKFQFHIKEYKKQNIF